MTIRQVNHWNSLVGLVALRRVKEMKGRSATIPTSESPAAKALLV